jgi:hypothetical protein
MSVEKEIPTLPENKEHLYESLYDRYGPALYGLILRFTTDTAVACAILTKSFLDIVLEKNGLVSGCDPFPCMLRITVKHCRKTLDLSAGDILCLIHPDIKIVEQLV